MTKQYFNWDGDAVAKLRELHSEGYSSTLIAQRLGLTRVSVARKSAKLGLVGVPTKTLPRPRTFSFTKRKPQPPKPIKVALVHPEALGPLEDFPACGCKYIHGDVRQGGWRMCGHQQVKGKSWCAFHAERVFEKTRAAA